MQIKSLQENLICFKMKKSHCNVVTPDIAHVNLISFLF